MLDLTRFNSLFVCFSYFIKNVWEDYDDSCSYCRQWRNSISNCRWQLLDWLKTQVRLQFKFFSVKNQVYNFYVNWIGPLDKAFPYITFSRADMCLNCSLSVKSMKFGMMIVFKALKKVGYGAIAEKSVKCKK